MYPVSARFLDVLTGSHRAIVRARLFTTPQVTTSPTGGTELPVSGGNVKMTSGADVKATLRYNPAAPQPLTYDVGCELTHGKLQHLIRAGHLEIEKSGDPGFEQLDVPVLDMTAVFPQVGGDPVRSRGFAKHRGLERIGLNASTSLPKGRNMINIDVQTLLPERHRLRPC